MNERLQVRYSAMRTDEERHAAENEDHLGRRVGNRPQHPADIPEAADREQPHHQPEQEGELPAVEPDPDEPNDGARTHPHRPTASPHHREQPTPTGLRKILRMLNLYVIRHSLEASSPDHA